MEAGPVSLRTGSVTVGEIRAQDAAVGTVAIRNLGGLGLLVVPGEELAAPEAVQ
ncbi:hypothetical protein GCM10010317_015850 [Streptomyces mirabilis]|nr:hypothetical protein GCM10010317_015850 [Streptomyces mirabilis]